MKMENIDEAIIKNAKMSVETEYGKVIVDIMGERLIRINADYRTGWFSYQDKQYYAFLSLKLSDEDDQWIEDVDKFKSVFCNVKNNAAGDLIDDQDIIDFIRHKLIDAAHSWLDVSDDILAANLSYNQKMNINKKEDNIKRLQRNLKREMRDLDIAKAAYEERLKILSTKLNKNAS